MEDIKLKRLSNSIILEDEEYGIDFGPRPVSKIDVVLSETRLGP